eukprot:2968489-Prymnesium_polylepis.1
MSGLFSWVHELLFTAGIVNSKLPWKGCEGQASRTGYWHSHTQVGAQDVGAQCRERPTPTKVTVTTGKQSTANNHTHDQGKRPLPSMRHCLAFRHCSGYRPLGTDPW